MHGSAARGITIPYTPSTNTKPPVAELTEPLQATHPQHLLPLSPVSRPPYREPETKFCETSQPSMVTITAVPAVRN